MSENENSQRTVRPSEQEWPELKSGDWVRIRSAFEIAGTLDSVGRTDGLSFMPEMAAYCGKAFRIGRSGTTVCIIHGDCQMACQFLWKSVWLESTNPPESVDAASDALNAADGATTPSELADRLSKFVKLSPEIYRCQATQLAQIAVPTPVHNLKQYNQSDLEQKRLQSWPLV